MKGWTYNEDRVAYAYRPSEREKGRKAVMNIFEFALQMELDGEQYYRELASMTEYADLQRVLNELAQDERRHYEIIQAAQREVYETPEDNPYLNEVHNIFINWHEGAGSLTPEERIAKLREEQLDVYRAALDKEKASVTLYQNLQAQAANEQERMICEKLKQEEEKHVVIIEDIIELMNRAHEWVECAEFNHQEDY